MDYSRRFPVLGLIFYIATFFSLSAHSQETILALEWGNPISNPDMGFNARIRSQHQLPFCEQPAPSPNELDWNNEELRGLIQSFDPGVLRFPGGTPANFWVWEDEVRDIVNTSGELEILPLCEGSLIGRSYSSNIGCGDAFSNMDFETLSEIYTNSTVTLGSYKAAMDAFRSQGIDVSEIFVLGMIDPLYYVGSPQLEYETSGMSVGQKISFMKANVISRVEAQLDKILLEYCGACSSYDAAFSFELGNELHLKRYGKFLPSSTCFDVQDICEECLPDVDFYSDLSEAVIPLIRSRFPNAKVAVNGSRDLGGEPWNQVIIDRFDSGSNQADAAMMHFYPKSFNPDSLSQELCEGLESAYDVHSVLRYQQVFTDYLFDQRNFNLFSETDMELWFTEFNNYDYSEQCELLFGTEFGDEDHTYDSGNWIHALSIFNLFNSFSHFASENEDIWSEHDRGMNITKMCMHMMFGRHREAAIRDDLQVSAAGMAIRSLMTTIQETDSFKTLLLTPPDRVLVNAQGEWQPSSIEGGIPLTSEFAYTDKHGDQVFHNTWDAYGWLFSNEDQEKLIIVNLNGFSLDLELQNLPGFSGLTHHKTYKVPKSKLSWTLDQGEESNGLNITEAMTDQSQIRIPPYSFTEISLDFTFPRPDNNGCSSSQYIEQSLWGEDNWTSYRYSGAGGNRLSCVDGATVQDIWFDFIPQSRDEVIMVRDLSDRLDLVIELYPDCDGDALACFNNYGTGVIEKAFLNDLEIGASYKFRVYTKSASPLDIDFVSVQIKTLSRGDVHPEICGNLGVDLDAEIMAVDAGQLYSSDPGIDAFRFKFISAIDGSAISYKNETQNPHILDLSQVDGLQPEQDYSVKVQHRLTTDANGIQVKLWSEFGEECLIGVENNCTAFVSAPVGLTKSMEPVNGVIDRIQLKWYKDAGQIPYSIADSAACDIEFWPVKDLSNNTPILNGMHTTLNLKRKEGQEFFKWPVKFNRSDLAPNISFKWKVRCACEYGAELMSPWSVEKFFNTPDFDRGTGIYTPIGGIPGGEDDRKPLVESLKVLDDHLQIFLSASDMEMDWSVQLTDIGGRVIRTDRMSSDGYQIKVPGLSVLRTGHYLLRISSEIGVEVRPFIIY